MDWTDAVVPEGIIPRKIRWFGLFVDIENPKGSWREWPGGRTFMHYDYGYIRKVPGEDGEDLDVYLGPNIASAQDVFVIHQRARPHFDVWDEDKCMIGFPDAAAAKAAYEAQYDNPGFFGGIESFETGEFVAYIKKHHVSPGTPLVTSSDLARQLALLMPFPEHLLQPLVPDQLQDLSSGPMDAHEVL